MADLTGLPVASNFGKVAPGEFVGRDLFFKMFTKSGGVDLDALVKAVEMRATVTVVGPTYDGGAAVNMVIEGFDLDQAALDEVITGYTVENLAGF